MAFVSGEGVVGFCDSTTGQDRSLVDVREPILFLGWNADRNRFTVGTGSRLGLVDRGSYIFWQDSRFPVPALCGCLSPSEKLVAIGYADGVVAIRSTASLPGAINPRGDLLVGRSPSSLCWTPDGQRLLVGDEVGHLSLWDTSSYSCLSQTKAHRKRVSSLSMSGDGAVVVSESADNVAAIWHVDADLSPLGEIEWQKSLTAAAVSPEGLRVTTIGSGGSVRLWDIAGLTKKRGAASAPLGLTAYAHRQAATVGRRGRAPAADAWVPSLPEGDGQRLLGMIRLPEVDNPSFSGIAITRDSRRAIVAGPDNYASAWDLTTGRQVWRSSEEVGYDLSLSPDGRWVAVPTVGHPLLILDCETGNQVSLCKGEEDYSEEIAWAPDSRRIASAAYNDSSRAVRIWDPFQGHCIKVCSGHNKPVQGLGWSTCGRFLASGGNGDDGVRIWDPDTGQCLRHFRPGPETVWNLKWSPDSRTLAVSYMDGEVLLLDAETGHVLHRLRGKSPNHLGASALGWSPDGRFVAAAFQVQAGGLHIWDSVTGNAVLEVANRSNGFWSRLAWAPNGAFLALSSDPGGAYFFDVRELRVLGASATAPQDGEPPPLTGDLRLLPLALARLLRLGIHPPLSLLRDLLAATGGRVGGALEALRDELRPLSELRWPEQARIGLVALLLHGLPQPDWQPPADATPSEVGEAVARALAGYEIPAEAPSAPVALLQKAAGRIDEKMLALLAMLGPEVVATDPGVTLRLISKVSAMPRLNRRQRELLGVRARADRGSSKAMGIAAGTDRVIAGGIEMGSLTARRRSLLPTQLALPLYVQKARHIRAELLFRSREAMEPPRLRPTVIVLDVSPPTFGPVESLTRMAAHIVASTLLDAGVPVVLVTPDDPSDAIISIEHRADLVEGWTRRTYVPAKAARLLRVASALRSHLQDGNGVEPAVLLMSHCWFGAEETLPDTPGLRGLFVRHPGHNVFPPAAFLCERHHQLAPSEITNIGPMLGELLA
jgi:ATP-dependent Clp protease ATP-binding subunit ClpC